MEDLQSPNTTATPPSAYIDSNCSTPYVSAPSSPGRTGTTSGYFYSAPASPVHFVLSKASLKPLPNSEAVTFEFEFEFSARFKEIAEEEEEIGLMSSADELFLNGQIRPLKLSTPVRRRTRSMSPLRDTTSFDWSNLVASGEEQGQRNDGKETAETTPSGSGSSSRCSSAGRSSKRWVFLKDFLRSKSEGRSNNHKFWPTNISFSSPAKDKKTGSSPEKSGQETVNKCPVAKGVGNRRGAVSAHEMHYTAKRAQAEEMRKKTYLPYRPGLFGCLGFSSKSYCAVNGLARAALNPVSSR